MLFAEGLFWIGAIGRVSLCPRQPWQESCKFPIFVRPPEGALISAIPTYE